MHFGDSLIFRDSQLWTVCELFNTFYTLRETAEVLGRGGAHYTTNPCKDIIINSDEVKRINEVVMPEIFKALYQILIEATENKEVNAQLLNLILDGDTSRVVNFMLQNKIATDDLKSIKGISNDDFTSIHTYYWRQYHANKKVKA